MFDRVAASAAQLLSRFVQEGAGPRFFAFEGPDGAGKTTYAKALEEDLAALGFDVTVVREPGSTPEGERIRELLKSPGCPKHPMAQFSLFTAARLMTVELIRTLLSYGRVVIADRYWPSTYAYQRTDEGAEALDFFGMVREFPRAHFFYFRCDPPRTEPRDHFEQKRAEVVQRYNALFDPQRGLVSDFTVIDTEATGSEAIAYNRKHILNLVLAKLTARPPEKLLAVVDSAVRLLQSGEAVSEQQLADLRKELLDLDRLRAAVPAVKSTAAASRLLWDVLDLLAAGLRITSSVQSLHASLVDPAGIVEPAGQQP